MRALSEHRRRRLAALLLAGVLAVLLAPLALAGCGGNTDPFSGLYWEPSTGRRIEIRREGDAYHLYYGRDQRSYEARRDGDRLIITEPMGGETVLRPGEAEGTLELVTGGKTTLLKPLPQHQ